MRFPEGFVWGAATASYQIEGAAHDDGRGPSIWDTFCRTPGKVYAGHTGDVACDHYHRYAAGRGADGRPRAAGVPLLGRLAADPAGRLRPGQPARAGLLRPAGRRAASAEGIDPIVTLYHWDLPQTLEDRGGWTNRETAEVFADYATAVYARLGDRVTTWTTLNEPWCSAYLGYGNGVHAPGRQDPAAAFTAVHHLLLGPRPGRPGAARGRRADRGHHAQPDHGRTRSTRPDSADQAAVRLVDGLANRIFLDPLLRGRVPGRRARARGPVHRPEPTCATATRRSSAPRSTCSASTTTSRRTCPRGPGAPGGGGAYPGTEGIEFRGAGRPAHRHGLDDRAAPA